jgi:hypothetical protein
VRKDAVSELCDENLPFAKTCSGQTQKETQTTWLALFLSSAGRTVLFMGSRVFSKAEVYDPLEKALQVPTPSYINV